MVIWERWIRLGVLFGLLLAGLVGCSTIARPPDDCPLIPSPRAGLIAKGDHYALEDWYKKEAALLRQHAKDLEVTLEEYRKNPSIARDANGKWHKLALESQFAGMIKVYGSAAEEADRLARWHNYMSTGTLKHNDPLNAIDPTSNMDVQPFPEPGSSGSSPTPQ
jgi:hypothetical protein